MPTGRWWRTAGGLVLDVPAKSLVEWTLKEAELGQPKLSGTADPLRVLTEASLERYGLPTGLTAQEKDAGRIPEGHKVIEQLACADWKLTKRGFGRGRGFTAPAKGSDRQCVQLCIPSWNALDPRFRDHAAQLPLSELAPVLGTYASRVMTQRGSTAVTSLELMTALHPPTHAVRDEETGALRQADTKTPGSLGTDPVDCAPREAPDGHPVLNALHLPRFHVRGPSEKLFEEVYDWARPMTYEECTLRHRVGLDVNMAFAAGANGLDVGLGEPTHVKAPAFGPKLPGSWLVDVDLSRVRRARSGGAGRIAAAESVHPTGPAWYATPTAAYAQELGYDVTPTEAYVRYDNGRFLDG